MSAGSEPGPPDPEATAPGPRGPSPALAALAGVVIVLGLAAAILLVPVPASSGYPLVPELTFGPTPPWLAQALAIGVFVAIVALIVGRTVRGGLNATWDFVLMLSIALGVGVAFAVLFRFLHPASAPTENATGGVVSNQTNHTCTSNCAVLGPGTPVGVAPWYDGLLLYGLIVASVVVAAYAVSRYRAAGFSPPRPPAAGPGATERLAEAMRELAASAGTDDARTRIVRAYGRLLTEVAAGLPDLGPQTPREIADRLVSELAIRPGTARTLTALFEEARYSHGHPMAPDAVDRAEAALQRAYEESSASRARGNAP